MFGYPETQRKIFKQNFLRSIIINLVFDPIVVTEYQDKIKMSLLNYFPRFRSKNDSSLSIEFRPNEKTPIVNVGEGVGGCQLFSEDGLSNISFSTTSIVLNIAGVSYQKFEDILPLLNEIQSLLPSIGIKQLRRLSMRKLNVANFETTELITVFEDMLRPSMYLNLVNSLPGWNDVSQHITNVSMVDGEYRMNLAYGIPPLNHNQKPLIKGIFVEDIDVIYESPDDVENMIYKLKTINQGIYEIFSWINSDHLKQDILGYEE